MSIWVPFRHKVGHRDVEVPTVDEVPRASAVKTLLSDRTADQEFTSATDLIYTNQDGSVLKVPLDEGLWLIELNPLVNPAPSDAVGVVSVYSYLYIDESPDPESFHYDHSLNVQAAGWGFPTNGFGAPLSVARTIEVPRDAKWYGFMATGCAEAIGASGWTGLKFKHSWHHAWGGPPVRATKIGAP